MIKDFKFKIENQGLRVQDSRRHGQVLGVQGYKTEDFKVMVSKFGPYKNLLDQTHGQHHSKWHYPGLCFLDDVLSRHFLDEFRRKVCILDDMFGYIIDAANWKQNKTRLSLIWKQWLVNCYSMNAMHPTFIFELEFQSNVYMCSIKYLCHAMFVPPLTNCHTFLDSSPFEP